MPCMYNTDNWSPSWKEFIWMFWLISIALKYLQRLLVTFSEWADFNAYVCRVWMLRSWPLGLYLLAFAFMHISRWVNQMNWIQNFGVIIVLLTSLEKLNLNPSRVVFTAQSSEMILVLVVCLFIKFWYIYCYRLVWFCRTVVCHQYCKR